ncbi:MAG: XamI family restriction endonuclease [Phycisphaerae bacterium]
MCPAPHSNADKPWKWKKDIAASVDLFNNWFLKFAPKAYRDTRVQTTEAVKRTLDDTSDLTELTPEVLKACPRVLATLRMSTCPPIARDRLIGLASVNNNLVTVMEKGKLPSRMDAAELVEHIRRITRTVTQLLDTDIFPWLSNKTKPTEAERYRAATIVADRLCGAVSDPIVRNAQEQRQLALIKDFLDDKGYRPATPDQRQSWRDMPRGTYCLRSNVVIRNNSGNSVNMPIDVIVQPMGADACAVPTLIEAKSAGDFTNTNKRRKEEATKVHQLRATYGSDVRFILFLCGYFDSVYLGYEAAEGIDWIWEQPHRGYERIGAVTHEYSDDRECAC